MNKNKNLSIEKLKKDIVVERLRQAPASFKVSFGMSSGRFLTRDELIEQVRSGTEVGERIVNIQLAYLKSFKKGKFK